MTDQKHVTMLLDTVAQGNDDAAAELWKAVHQEVRQMAANS